MSGTRRDDLLVAQAEDDAERPVRGPVLRADVEVHERRVVVGAGQAPHLGLEAQLLLHLVDHLVGQLERPVLGAAGRVLLAQRVPVPPRRHEQPVQVVVAGDVDAEHVPELALVPVGGGPHAGHALHLRRLRRQRHLEAHVGVPPVGDEVVVDAEGGVGHALAVQPLALVHAAEVVEHRERLGGLLAQVPQHLGRAVARDPGGRDAVLGLLLHELQVREPLVQLAQHRGLAAVRPRRGRRVHGPLAGLRRARGASWPCWRGSSSITSRPGAGACRWRPRRRGAGRAG